MTKNQNARTDAATSSRAKNLEGAATPLSLDDKLSRAPLSSLLNTGAKNALTARDIGAMTGWTPREIRVLAERERRQGIPLCSDTMGGYFIAASEAEKAAFVRSMRHRADEIRKTADAVEEAVIS